MESGLLFRTQVSITLVISKYRDIVHKVLAMFGLISMTVISDNQFTTGFQSSVKHFKKRFLVLDM